MSATTPAAFIAKYAPRPVAGLATGESRQISTLGKIDKFDFIIQEETLLGPSFSDQAVCLTPGGVLAISSSSDARAIFRNADSAVLFVTTQQSFRASKEAAVRLQSLLPDFCVMSFVVLDNRGTDLYSDGLSLAAAVPAPPFQIVRSSRTVHSSDHTEAWTVWIARIDGVDHKRADPRQADLRPLRLLEKGEDPDILSFADSKVSLNQMALQCASS